MRFPGSGGVNDDHVDASRGRRAGGRLVLVAAVVLLLFGGSTLVSWYVEALWFDSLGFSEVFWTTITLKTTVFWVVAALTFAILFGAFRLLRPRRLAGQTLYVNGQPVTFSLAPIVSGASWAVALMVALVSASSIMQEWATIALYLNAPAPAGAFATARPDLRPADPVLPADAARPGPGRQLADDPRDGDPRRLPGGVRDLRGGGPAAVRRAAGARRLPRGVVLARLPPARAGGARVPLALRPPVRRSHDLLGRGLHRGQHRHPGPDLASPPRWRSARGRRSTTASARGACPASSSRSLLRWWSSSASRLPRGT